MAARLSSAGILRRVRSRLISASGFTAIIVLSSATSSPARAQTPTPLPRFNLQLTTTRGCFETGQNPVYVVGESVTVAFTIGSSTVQQATATLFDILPDGNVGVLIFAQIPTNQTFAFGARVTPPLGIEQLRLKASAPGVQTTRVSCTFLVVSAPTPGVTMTPSPAATPPPSATAAASVTATPSPAALLHAEIRTNRGCLETKDNAVFAIGEPIRVSFEIDSTVALQAFASVFDFLPNGFVNVFSFGFVPTNVSLAFGARVALPTGVESLALRASISGFQTTSERCSFEVVAAGPSPTPTGSSVLPSMTPTATPTPTPPAGSNVLGCAGACTQAGTVTVDDLVTVISIAAGDQDLSACPAADADGNGEVTIDEVLMAVNNALNGCSAGG